MALFPGWRDGGLAAGCRRSPSSWSGLIITAGLVLLAQKAYADNEDRLVRQRVKEVTAVLTAAIPSIEAPLATTAEVVQADMDPELFGMALDSQTGPRPTDRFVAGALLAADDSEMLDNLGQPALLNRDEDEIRAFVQRTLSAEGMTVLDLLDGETPRLGYGYAAADRASVVYAEAPLPADRTQAAQPDSAFANIDYALYLETPEGSRTLLLASTDELPLRGPARRGGHGLRRQPPHRRDLAGRRPRWIAARRAPVDRRRRRSDDDRGRRPG